jgi:hypothetical protein
VIEANECRADVEPSPFVGLGAEITQLFWAITGEQHTNVGPGSSGKPDTHAISTMMLPLAHYIESVVDAA